MPLFFSSREGPSGGGWLKKMGVAAAGGTKKGLTPLAAGAYKGSMDTHTHTRWIEFRVQLMRRGWSVRRLAREVGVSETHIIAMVRGSRSLDTPAGRRMQAVLAELLGVEGLALLDAVLPGGDGLRAVPGPDSSGKSGGVDTG